MQDTRNDTSLPSSPIMKGMNSAFGKVTCCLGTMSAYRKKAIMPCHLFDAWANENSLYLNLHSVTIGIFFWKQTKKELYLISNLINNAFKFTKQDGGTILVNVGKERREGNDYGDGYNNQEVVFRVKDTASGIDPEIFPRLGLFPSRHRIRIVHLQKYC